MSDSVLVDTSAWIVSFREMGNQRLKDCLRDAIDLDRAVTTNVVVLELLQGCKTMKEYDSLKDMLAILLLRRLMLPRGQWRMNQAIGSEEKASPFQRWTYSFAQSLKQTRYKFFIMTGT